VKRIALVVGVFAAFALWLAYRISWGLLGEHEAPGEIRGEAVPTRVVFRREAARGARAAALGVPRGRQILFGDLHAHTTFPRMPSRSACRSSAVAERTRPPMRVTSRAIARVSISGRSMTTRRT